MGYTAEAVGNHDFDFGSVDSPAARQLPGDLRGALKARAAQARYPFLAANLIDDATGPTGRVAERSAVGTRGGGRRQSRHRRRDDDRCAAVDPRSQRAGTADRAAWRRRSPPRRRSFARPAPKSSSLRRMRAGAAIDSISPADLSSCDAESEIFQVARSLPAGWWTSSPPVTRTAGSPIRSTGSRIMQPLLARPGARSRRRRVRSADQARRADPALRAAQHLRAADSSNRSCIAATESGVPATVRRKSGHARSGDRSQAMAAALAARSRAPGDDARRVARRPRFVASAIVGSPLGNLFADALRAAVPGADVAVINNAARGLWADLPDGPLTFGRLYDVFPFDNRIVRIDAERRRARTLAGRRDPGRAVEAGWAFQGSTCDASCVADGLHVDLFRAAGRDSRRRSVGRRDDRRRRRSAATWRPPFYHAASARRIPSGQAPRHRSGQAQPETRRSCAKWSRIGFGAWGVGRMVNLARPRSGIRTMPARASTVSRRTPRCSEIDPGLSAAGDSCREKGDRLVAMLGPRLPA